MSEPAVWYRYEEVTYATVDEWGYLSGKGRTVLERREFYVVKETPKGVWLTPWLTMPATRFVLRQARKRYACPTQAEALESFVARKTRQLDILRSQIRRIEIALAQVPKSVPAVRGRTDMSDLRLNAYYYGFTSTGVPEIDKILSAVACAGKAFHGTEFWTDDCEWPPHKGRTPEEWIQNAANEAAEAMRATQGKPEVQK